MADTQFKEWYRKHSPTGFRDCSLEEEVRMRMIGGYDVITAANHHLYNVIVNNQFAQSNHVLRNTLREITAITGEPKWRSWSDEDPNCELTLEGYLLAQLIPVSLEPEMLSGHFFHHKGSVEFVENSKDNGQRLACELSYDSKFGVAGFRAYTEDRNLTFERGQTGEKITTLFKMLQFPEAVRQGHFSYMDYDPEHLDPAEYTYWWCKVELEEVARICIFPKE